MLHGRTNFTDWKKIQTSSLLPVQQNGGLDPLYGNPVLQQMQFQSQQSPPQSVQQGYGQKTGNFGFLQSQLQQQNQEVPPSQQQQQTQQVLHEQSHQEMQQHLSSSCHDIANVASNMSESAPASQLQSSLLPVSSFYQQSIFEGNGGPGLHLHNRSKDRRKKRDGFYTGKKNRDMKPIQDKMVTSVAMANFRTTSTNNVTPFSISMQHPNQQSQAPKEAPVVDCATQLLLEENNQLLNKIAANIESLKAVENTGLFVCMSSNIKTILSRMSESPGIFMGQMPPLPFCVNEDNLRACLEAGFFRSFNVKP